MSKMNISIPQPCHEDWNKMSTVDKGKFCASCQKNVIDFTTATDKEIINALEKDNKLCGRFLNSQLNRDLIQPKEKSSIWLATTSAIISLIGLNSHEAIAQEEVKTEQTDKKVLNDTITSINNEDEFIISGVVIDDVGPLPGANVTVKGTNITTQTDFDGKFSIKAKIGDILVFHFVGMETLEQEVTNKLINEILKTKLITRLLNGTVGGLVIRKRTFFGRLFHKSNYK